jgi:hypothetical protein
VAALVSYKLVLVKALCQSEYSFFFWSQLEVNQIFSLNKQNHHTSAFHTHMTRPKQRIAPKNHRINNEKWKLDVLLMSILLNHGVFAGYPLCCRIAQIARITLALQ